MGYAFFIKSNITYKIKENESVKNVEYIHVQFILNNKQFNLINIYNPGGKIHKDEYNLLFAVKNFIICGDFNSKNTLWGSNAIDYNGKIIQELIDEHDLYLLNNGTGTHITYSGIQTPLYLTFVSYNLANISNWNVPNETLGSDHFLIEIQIYQNRKIFKENMKSNSWHYKKAKWSLFQESLENLQNNRNVNNLEINEYWKIISNEITDTANKYIPKIRKTIKTQYHFGMINVQKQLRKENMLGKKLGKASYHRIILNIKEKKLLHKNLLNLQKTTLA